MCVLVIFLLEMTIPNRSFKPDGGLQLNCCAVLLVYWLWVFQKPARSMTLSDMRLILLKPTSKKISLKSQHNLLAGYWNTDKN